MRQVRRGATLKKRGPAWICPVDEGELHTDEAGHIKRRPGALHPWLRTWEEWELAANKPPQEKE
jgi:hypothetical protein